MKYEYRNKLLFKCYISSKFVLRFDSGKGKIYQIVRYGQLASKFVLD